MFELFDHTADLGLRVRADSFEELLAEAARGLLAMLVANPAEVRPVQLRTIGLPASLASFQLFDWLSELLYVFESEKLLLSEFNVEITPGGRLSAVCYGEPMDESRHQMDHEVKAITYHNLRLEQLPDQTWFAEVIVDI